MQVYILGNDNIICSHYRKTLLWDKLVPKVFQIPVSDWAQNVSHDIVLPKRFATSDSATFVFNYSIFFLFVCMFLFASVDCFLIGSRFQQISESITTTPQKIEIQKLAWPEES